MNDGATNVAGDAPNRADRGRLLAIGDIHLGTRPSRVPAIVAEGLGGGIASLTPAAALASAVELAVRERVDGVLFAGDVVESNNARFEALPALEGAVRRLAEAGIPAVGVAGNHDVDALPRVADLIEGFRLLGRGGQWESTVLDANAAPLAEIVGWSFPEQRVTTSPVRALLDTPLAPAAAGVPRIGLLHGDLGASGGHYAPIARQELDDAGLDAWLLGHIHKPSLAAGATPCGYLGSLVGLDPTETGAHGPWMIRLSQGGAIVPELLPTAPLRWEAVDVRPARDLAPDDVEDLLFAEAEATARRLVDEGSKHRVLGLRLHLVGPVDAIRAIRTRIGREAWRDVQRSVADTTVFIEQVSDRLEVAADLHELARGEDPPGLLARKLLLLEEAGDERRALLDRTRTALAAFANDARFTPLDDLRDAGDPLSDEALVDYLQQSGMETLQKLLGRATEHSEADA